MARPVVSSTTERFHELLGPLRVPDPERDWPLLKYITPAGEQLHLLNVLIEDKDDGEPGWAILFDPDRAPAYALDFTAQMVGVRLLFGLDEESQRLRIKETAGQKRGTPAAIRGAMRQKLTGTRTTQIFERYQGDAYALRVRTFAAETPDSAAVLTAVLEQKPAGIVLTYDVSDGQTVAELTASGLTVAQVTTEYPTVNDVKYGIPPEV